jgi:hypothetical protein
MLETVTLHSIGIDKLQHFSFYAIIAFLLAVIVCLIPPLVNGFQRICAVAFSLMFIGILEEYRQLLLPERTTEWQDAVANMFGVSIGVFLPLLIHLQWQGTKRLQRSFLSLGAAILFVLTPLMYGLTVVSEPIPTITVHNDVFPVYNAHPEEIGTDETKISEHALTPEMIIEKYRLQLEELKQYANQNIEQLAEEAINEWKAKQMPLTALYTKYIERANELEKQINAEFQQIYETAKTDLQQHGFASEYANTLKQEYEDTKAEQKAAIMQKVAGELL